MSFVTLHQLLVVVEKAFVVLVVKTISFCFDIVISFRTFDKTINVMDVNYKPSVRMWCCLDEC